MRIGFEFDDSEVEFSGYLFAKFCTSSMMLKRELKACP